MTSTTTPKMMTLRCQHGEGHDWTRPSQRGKPPTFCPEHKPQRTDAQIAKDMARIAREGTTTDHVLAKRDRKVTGGNIDVKIAQANDELAQLDAEEARKKAEAIAKRQATLAAKKQQEAQQEVEGRKDELARIIATLPESEGIYESALAKANKTNKREDWHTADTAQARLIGMLSRRRSLERQMSA